MLTRALVWTALLSVTAAVPTANDQYPDLLPADCGRRQIQLGDTTRPFIVGEGNTTAYYGQYPWQARILTYNKGKVGFTHQCGAIIITDHHVLTAAHCVQEVAKSSILVRVGELRFARSDAEFAAKEFGIASIHIHYLFTGAPGLPNDIALLRLRIKPGDNLQFNAYVAPACLPAASAVYETNLPCEVSGWSRTADFSPISDQLRGVEVPLVSDEFCSTPEVYQDRFVTGRMFCAGLTTGGADACRGDSGGPLACMDEGRGRFIAYGIVSSGDPLGCGLRPGLYTKVSHYISWIQRRLQLDREDRISEMSQMRSDSGCGPVTFRPPTYLGTAKVQSQAHFPWTVQVWYLGNLVCSGVIISDRWILTAEVCTSQGKVSVRIGDVQDSTDFFPIQMEIETVVIQPPPKEPSREKVFALLKTNKPIIFTDNVKPICLPDDSSLSPVRAGLDLIFVAWNVPIGEEPDDEPYLRWSRLRVVDKQGCETNYSTINAFKVNRVKYFHDDTFCTKFIQRTEEGECAIKLGDSGGVFVDRLIGSDGRESWRVLGTSVGGYGCGSDTYPDLNAALGPVIPWVRSVLDEDAFLNQLEFIFSCDNRIGK